MCMIPSSVCRPPPLSSSRSPIQFRLCRISYICRLPKVGKKARNSSPRSTLRIGRRVEDQKKQGEQNKVLGAALAIDPSSPYPCIRGFILPLSFLCLFCVSISSSIHSPTPLPRPLSLSLSTRPPIPQGPYSLPLACTHRKCRICRMFGAGINLLSCNIWLQILFFGIFSTYAPLLIS